MIDPAIAIIDRQPREQLQFNWLRRYFMTNDPDVWSSLDSGRAVLQTIDQLNQYLWTHGLMIEAQWRYVADWLPEVESPSTLIDYGCGQGIGGLLLDELTAGAAFAELSRVILIDWSRVAMTRAQAIYKKLCPGAAVSTLCKSFNGIDADDIAPEPRGSTLHLFSNSLDVPGFDPLRLVEKTFHHGRHTILAVSHDREHNGGTPRFRTAKAAVENPAMSSDLTIRRSAMEQFKCGENGKWDAVVWLCDLEVHDD